MPRVLVIEDEVVLRASMARGLRKLPDVEVAEAGTLAEALLELDQHPPQLVVSDIDLPDRSGLELLGEIGKRGRRVPVLFVSAYLKAYGPQIPRYADVEVREKPISLDELRQIVVRKLGCADVRPGAFPFSVADFVQIACMGRHSVTIELERGGSAAGRVRILDGNVWSAEYGDEIGEGAFRQVLFADGEEIFCRAITSAEAGPRNLQGDWRELLMEAARLEDEASRVPERAPEPQRPVEAPFPVVHREEAALASLPTSTPPVESPEAEFDRVWEQGASALLAKDLEAAYRSFLRADELKPGDWRVRANLTRLRNLGVPNLPTPERKAP